MAVTPIPGVSAQTVLNALYETDTDLQNLRSIGGTALEQFNRYQEWADRTANRLGRMLPSDDLDRLVTTTRYWAIQSIDPATRSLGALAGFVQLEIEERLREIQRTRRALQEEVSRWDARVGTLVVADTNIYLHHDRYFDEIS